MMTGRGGGRLLRLFARVRTPLFWTLVIAAAGLRVLLAWFCPTPFGYVYDYYHEAIEHFFESGRLPIAADCWQCYHPPLFYVLGLPLYAAGHALARGADYAEAWGQRALCLLPLVASTIAAAYGYRTVRFLVRDRALSLVGVALILAFPCLFISSWAPETDVVVTALMAVFLYCLVRFAARPARQRWQDALVLGVLAGLAAATKYSGLIALATAGVVVGLQLPGRPVAQGFSPARPARASRLRTVALGLLILAVAVGVGGWKYLDNQRRYGRALFANGSAGDAFSAGHENYWDQYDFFTFDLPLAIRTAGPHAPPGQLTHLPLYRSVWTTLYAMGWGDASFFSVRGRIDDEEAPYPDKHISPWLTGSVLYLGFVPTLLAAIGAVITLPRRAYWPLTAMFVLTLGSYLPWVVAQDEWALKTKYILFLLPIYVAWSLAGLRWVRRRAPSYVAEIVVVLIAALVVVAHVYLFAFAVGGF